MSDPLKKEITVTLTLEEWATIMVRAIRDDNYVLSLEGGKIYAEAAEKLAKQIEAQS